MQLIESASEQKLRGGFYTPEPIAHFILKWSINGDVNFDILEPSCGDGVFIDTLKNYNFKFNSLTAIELDSIEAEKANQIDLENKTIINSDFHNFCNTTKQKFDLVIGNPPYIRYQFFDKAQQIEAEAIFRKVRLKYSKLTNAWVSFVIGASLLLKETGKIAYVLPAEILQVSYAHQLRNFLANFYNKINIVSFQKLVFPEIQQEVVLLLCEKNKSGEHLIEHLEVKDLEELKKLDVLKLKSPKKQIDTKAEKWTYYFLEQKEIDFLNRIKKEGTIPTIGKYAVVEVGITTGANDYFSVPLSIVNQYNLSEYAKPLVGRSVQVSGIKFTEEDWLFNKNADIKAHLLVFPSLKKMQENELALKYIELGLSQNIHKGYKTGIRNEWQIIPSIWQPDAFFIRRNNIFPKFITNDVNAYSTDTMHRIRVKEGTNLKAITASYYNSLSFAFSEISGRSYGGGVLELMPNEVESIFIPYHEKNAELVDDIDTMLRNKTDIDTFLKFTNEKILKQNYDFDNADIEIATNIWKKLSNRRLNRTK